MAKYMTVGDCRDRLGEMVARGQIAEDYRVVLSWTDPNRSREVTPVREISAVDQGGAAGVPDTLVLTPGDPAIPPLAVGTLRDELARMIDTGWIAPQYRLGAARSAHAGASVGYVQALCATGPRLELSMWEVQPE
jgi:hypothetical protein